MKLLDAVSDNTTGTGVKADGGSKTLVVWGADFGGGSVAIEASPDGGTTWIALTISGSPAAFTANTIRQIDYLGQGLQVRAVLSGATAPDAVSAALF